MLPSWGTSNGAGLSDESPALASPVAVAAASVKHGTFTRNKFKHTDTWRTRNLATTTLAATPRGSDRVCGRVRRLQARAAHFHPIPTLVGMLQLYTVHLRHTES